ncbi:MAG: hypothetical protein HUJ31_19525 [Pseudomonadales bacterium]|nr:hypothetical protein [Pseudomonadales bacterium]
MELNNPFGPDSRIGKFWRRRTALLRARFSAQRQQAALHKCFLQLMAAGPDNPRTPGIALKLYELWGDPLDQARESYLRSCLKEFDESEGHVLVSSASLLGLILGALSNGDKDRTVWCLEEDPHWTHVLRSWLKRYGIKGTHVISAPVTVKAGTVRYRIHPRHLPRNIGLVLCDAPSASPGSALSMLLSVSGNFASDFTLLARKIRAGDGSLMKRWTMKHDATFVMVNKRDGFIKISRRRDRPLTLSERATYIIDIEDRSADAEEGEESAETEKAEASQTG